MKLLLSFICQGGDVKSTPIRRTGDLKPSSIAVISVRIVERLLDGGLLSFCGMTEVGDNHQLKFRDSCTCFSTSTFKSDAVFDNKTARIESAVAPAEE